MWKLWVVLGLFVAGVAFAQDSRRTSRLRLPFGPNANYNDALNTLDRAAVLEGNNLFRTQQRIVAAGPPTSSNPTGAGGLDIDASGITTGGIGLIIENNRNPPITPDPSGQGWIVLDGDASGAGPFVGQPALVIESHATSSGGANQPSPVFAFRRSGGTHGAPTVATLNTHILGTMLWQGYDADTSPWGNSTQGGVAAIEAYATETYSATNHGSIIAAYSIPTGSSTLSKIWTSTTAGHMAVPGRLKIGAETAPAVALDVAGNFAVTGGVSSSSGIQHVRHAATCTTAASVGAACTSGALNWPTSFANTNYTATCTLTAVTGQPHIVVVTKSAASITVTIAADTAGAATAAVDCIAFHD